MSKLTKRQVIGKLVEWLFDDLAAILPGHEQQLYIMRQDWEKRFSRVLTPTVAPRKRKKVK